MRLQQQSEYLGGSTPVIINPIAQTFSMEGSKPLGSLQLMVFVLPKVMVLLIVLQALFTFRFSFCSS